MSKQFTWLGPDTFTRKRGSSGGVRLAHDETYNVSDFDAAVVDEWVATGFAKFVDAKSKKDKEA